MILLLTNRVPILVVWLVVPVVVVVVVMMVVVAMTIVVVDLVLMVSGSLVVELSLELITLDFPVEKFLCLLHRDF